MKTELDQLKENAKMEYAKQRSEEFIDYLRELIKRAQVLGLWSRRADALTIFSALVWFAFIPIALVFQVPLEIFEVASAWLFNIFVMTVFRSHYHELKWKYADGVLDGAMETLNQLGMTKILEDDQDGEKKKRVAYKSRFKRFKEFFERIKSPQSNEAVA